ncbi:hypothetical protein RCO48_38640 [Peribacillus frigoritolerans]|nr:hypothetical protein [Peribacillus frigoritolerans]
MKNYEESYEKFHITNPNLPQKWTETEEMNLMLPSEVDESIPTTEIIHESSAPYGEIYPRFAQIEALEELNKTMEEDYDKALVVMATGLGKDIFQPGSLRAISNGCCLLHILKKFYIRLRSHSKRLCRKRAFLFIMAR